MAEFKELDLVALVRDRPDLELGRGWVGTLLLELAPGVWEVEFADGTGRSAATRAIEAADLLLLKMEPVLG